MADEQGLSEPGGFFARQAIGKAVKSLLTNVGVDGRKYPARSSPPSNPEVGDVYLADGSGWDPNAAGSEELVAYNGSSWTSITVL